MKSNIRVSTQDKSYSIDKRFYSLDGYIVNCESSVPTCNCLLFKQTNYCKHVKDAFIFFMSDDTHEFTTYELRTNTKDAIICRARDRAKLIEGQNRCRKI